MTDPDAEPVRDGPEDAQPGRAEDERPSAPAGPAAAAEQPAEDLGAEESANADSFAAGAGTFNYGQHAMGDHATSIGSIHYSYGTQGETRCWSGEMTAESIARLSDTYVRCPSDDELDRRLRVQALVFLGGPAGTGRRVTTHVALARRHAADKVACIVLAPGTPITAVLDRPELLREGCGHVIEPDLRPDPMALAALETQAKSRDATVVVIGSIGRERDLADYVVEHRMPDLSTVFRAHLVHRLGERGECVGACVDCRGHCMPPYVDLCLRHPDLAAELSAAGQISEATSLAARIAAEAPKGDELDVLLADVLPARLRRNAEQILRVTTDPNADEPSAEYRRAFRIAYAAFDGLPLTWVFEAADRLMDPAAEDRRAPALGVETRLLVGDGMCSPTVDTDESPRRARMRSDGLVRAMLDVAWNDWGLSGHMLRWLDGLVESDRPGVRDRAADVAGWLAGRDFVHVYDFLVDRWAGSRKGELRGAAARALLATAMDRRVQPAVGERIRDWLADGSAYQRATVARAYVYGLGRIRQYQALDDLREVGRDRMQRRNEMIAIAVDVTYPCVAAGTLVRALRGWVEADDELLRLHAVRALVRLASRPSDERTGWPELLARTASGDVALADLVALWVPALVHPVTAFDAWRRLGYWISRADGRVALAEWLATLLARLSDDRPLRDRVTHHLEHVWRQQMPSNPFLLRLAAILEGDST